MAKSNKVFFSIHSFLGIWWGSLLLIISLSGSVIVFTDELEELFYKDLVSAYSSATSVASLDVLYYNAYIDFPEYKPFRIVLPENGQAIKIGLQKDNFSEYFYACYHPSTGERLGLLKNSFTQVLLKIHYTFLAGKVGVVVAALSGLLLMVSSITGLYVYRKNIVKTLLFRTKFSFTSFRSSFSTLHRFLGAWCFIFSVILGFTGFWILKYSFDPAFFVAKKNPPLPGLVTVSLDELQSKVALSLPSVTLRRIELPREKNGLLLIKGSEKGFLTSPYGSVINLDPESGEVLDIVLESQLGFWDKLGLLFQTIHFGQFGGPVIKALYCLIGISISMLTITGFLTRLKRKNGKSREKLSISSQRETPSSEVVTNADSRLPVDLEVVYELQE